MGSPQAEAHHARRARYRLKCPRCGARLSGDDIDQLLLRLFVTHHDRCP